MSDIKRNFWLKRARREALRFNFGWWLQFFLRAIFGLGLIGSAGIIALRTSGHGLLGLSVALLAMALVATAASVFLARERFLSLSEALARLDSDLGLHTRLSSAFEGVGEWPPPRPGARLALGWNWRSLLKAPGVAAALVVASIFVPLPKGQLKPTGSTAHPPSWDSIQIKLDALRDSEVVQAEAIANLQKSLDALRNQPAEQWYRHESLEASSQLQAQLDQSAGRLGEQLEIALTVMEAAREMEAHQMQALAKPLDHALGESLKAMELETLSLNEETLGKLRELDSSRIRQLSAEEWKSVSDRLKGGVGASANRYSQSREAREGRLPAILGSGTGDVERGPGTAPLMLQAEKTDLQTTQTEGVGSDDLSKAALGDLTGLGAAEPQADKAPWTSGESGGANASAGTGGTAVWDQVATPAEQEALRRFFK